MTGLLAIRNGAGPTLHNALDFPSEVVILSSTVPIIAVSSRVGAAAMRTGIAFLASIVLSAQVAAALCGRPEFFTPDFSKGVRTEIFFEIEL
jgi:hypothetical protein